MGLTDPDDFSAPLVRLPFHFMSKEQKEEAPKWMKELHEKFRCSSMKEKAENSPAHR